MRLVPILLAVWVSGCQTLTPANQASLPTGNPAFDGTYIGYSQTQEGSNCDPLARYYGKGLQITNGSGIWLLNDENRTRIHFVVSNSGTIDFGSGFLYFHGLFLGNQLNLIAQSSPQCAYDFLLIKFEPQKPQHPAGTAFDGIYLGTALIDSTRPARPDCRNSIRNVKVLVQGGLVHWVFIPGVSTDMPINVDGSFGGRGGLAFIRGQIHGNMAELTTTSTNYCPYTYDLKRS